MAMAWPSLFCMNREAFGLRIVKVNIEKVEKISKKSLQIKKSYGMLIFVADNVKQQHNGSLVKRLRHRPFTAVTRVRFP